MKLLILVDFYWERDKDPRIPLGHASLRAALAQRGRVEVRGLVYAVNAETTAQKVLDDIRECARGREPDEVDLAFGAYVWGEALLQKVVRQLRADGWRGRIILGGPQVSYSGPGLEAIYPGVTVFIRGYGEEALCALVEGQERTPGVHWAGEADAEEQAAVALDALPSPWLSGLIPLKGQRFVRWETQRGCPFQCAFCQHREAGKRMKRRALDLQRVEAEIDLFCAEGVDDIAVLDPIFNADERAVVVLRRLAERGYRGKISLQCRAETMDDEFLDAAAALRSTLELGLQTIHPQEGKAISRWNNLGKMDEVLAGMRARGIRHQVSLIFGLPLQTLASFEESVQWCLEREVQILKAFPLLLLRGTPLERDRDRWGLRDIGGSMPMVVESSSFGFAEWVEMAKRSQALLESEEAHPANIEALRARAAPLVPDLLRWLPEQLVTDDLFDKSE